MVSELQKAVDKKVGCVLYESRLDLWAEITGPGKNFKRPSVVINPALEWLRFPEEAPRIIAAIEPGHNPSVLGARTPDGSFLIIDGEIFDLAGQMEGPANHAAVLLALYQKQGAEIFERLDASASIVLWDAKIGKVFVYRDRYGMVPSFYAQQSGYTVWSSEMGTLLPFVEDTSVNLGALDFLLKDGFHPCPLDFCKNPYQSLQPAHCLSIGNDGQSRETRYWLPQPKQIRDIKNAEAVENIGTLLTQSLARRASPDARLGVMLSGGVDSKLVAATLRLKLQRELESFTFHYEDYDGIYNENSEAKRAAEFLGTTHHEAILWAPPNRG